MADADAAAVQDPGALLAGVMGRHRVVDGGHHQPG